MKTFFYFFLFCFFSNVGYAKTTGPLGFGVGIEPIIGYERVQKILPTAHTTDRLTYGARLTVGIPLIAAEAEYLRGTDTETFPVSNLVITDTDDRLKAGIRSSLGLGALLRFTLRGGVQATQNQHQETVNGVVTTQVTRPIVYYPYAGAGLRVRLSNKLNLSGDIIAVIPNTSDLSKNEYQTTLGLTVRFP